MVRFIVDSRVPFLDLPLTSETGPLLLHRVNEGGNMGRCAGVRSRRWGVIYFFADPVKVI